MMSSTLPPEEYATGAVPSPLPAAAGAKHSSDAAAREQLEKVVEVLVSGE